MDEHGPEYMGELWRSQHVDPVRLSPDELRRRAERFEAKMKWRFRLAVALLIFLAAGYGAFLYFFPDPIQRLGSGLTLAGFVYGAWHLYRRGPTRLVPPGPALSTCAAYRAELERQREFHLTAWARLVAFVPGPVIFISAFVAAEQGAAKALGVAMVLVLAPFAAGIPTNLRAARKLEREIDRLDAWARQP